MAKQVPVNRLRFLIPFLQQYELKGGATADFEADLKVKESADLDPDMLLPATLINHIVNRISAKLDNPYLGYVVGKQSAMKKNNPFFTILDNSHSLGDALCRLVTYFDTGSTIGGHNLLVTSKYTILYGQRQLDISESSAQADACFVAFIVHLVKQIVGVKYLESNMIVKIPYPEAIPATDFLTVTQGDTKQIAIQIPSSWLSASKQGHTVDESESARINYSYSGRTKEYLMSNICSPDMDSAAIFCGVSKAYLREQLIVENSSYNNLLTAVRMNQAKATLQLETTISIEALGFAVGYKRTSNFIRAFRREVGMTPLQYRKQSACR